MPKVAVVVQKTNNFGVKLRLDSRRAMTGPGDRELTHRQVRQPVAFPQ
jgi:hypothetical protein